jgi:hypothetical protein
MRRRRRQERKAVKLAKLLVSLDEEACANRPWRPRRVRRAALTVR